MKTYRKIIMTGKSGTCRAPMAMALLKRRRLRHPAEILARGMVVLFPEPINPKAEAVLVSNGIHIGDYTSTQLSADDFGEDTLILTFSADMRDRIRGMEGAKNVYVLTEVTGDELEILDPYGADLAMYDLCFETLDKTIGRLADLLNSADGHL